MTTKEKLRTKTARIREEAAQTGRVVIHAPVLIRGAECVIRFLLGAILAGAEVFGDYAPFGVAMVGASGSGAAGFSALLGACFGYLSFLGFTESLRYVAASILTFSVAFAFFDVKLYRKTWFMPVVTALLCGATSFVYLSDRGCLTSDVIFFVTELLFAGAGVY
ncbi:MAG: stage II sporulation protein E, partial [Clostridia bacterium]|nr:stage II sporulation protein E [Clostridia bacterium]